MKRVAIVLLIVGAIMLPMTATVATAQLPERCSVNRVHAGAPPDEVPVLGTPLDTPAGIVYLEFRAGSSVVIEIYKESNHVRDLQRGGTAQIGGGEEDEGCVDDANVAPDDLIL